MAESDPQGRGPLAYSVDAPLAGASQERERPRAPAAAQYVIGAEEGRGATGRVVRAFDERLGRDVALKELLASHDETARARFLREARLTARLQHPSIVPIYDLGEREDGTPDYAMKLVAGSTLADAIAKAGTLEARLALLPHVAAIAEAVAFAHDRRIIHRDLKPSNVVLGGFGETVVVDWGSAKDLASGVDSDLPPALGAQSAAPERSGWRRQSPAAEPGETQLGAVIGTPAYMAPEQWRGERVDERADVFALGAMLYETLTAHTPYEGETLAESLARRDRDEMVPIEDREPSVAPELAAIVREALRSAPAERYPSAKAFAEDLGRFLTGQVVRAHRYGTATLVRRWIAQHRALVALTLVSVALIATMGVVSVRRVVRERDRADQKALALLETQGRTELEAGRPFRAAVLLSEAYRQDPASMVLRSLVTEALRPLGARRFALVGHTRDVPAGTFSPDGTRFVTASSDRTARIWDPEKSSALHVLEGFDAQLEWTAFSARGDTVAVASGGTHPKVSLFDVATGKLQRAYPVPDVYRVAFTPDGAGLVVGAHHGELSIVDRATGATRFEVREHKSRVSAMAFSPDGTTLVVGSWDKGLTFWDWQKGARLARVEGFESPISSLAFSPDGRELLVAEEDAAVHTYDAATRARLRTLRLPEGAVSPDAVFGADPRTIVTSAHDGRVRVWHAASGAPLRLIDVQPSGKLFHVALRPDGQRAVTLGVRGSVNVWSLADGVDYRLLGDDDPLGVAPDVESARFVDGERAILTGYADGHIRILDASGATRTTLTSTGIPSILSLDEKSRRLAVSGENPDAFPARLFDVASGKEVARFEGHAPPITYGLAVDGRGAVWTGGYEGSLKRWSVESGALLATVALSTRRISCLAIGEKDARPVLAAATDDGVVHLVDPDAGRETSSFSAHPSWIQEMSFEEGGRRLITVGRQDHVAKRWDLSSLAQPSMTFVGHTANLTHASLSPDGTRLATAAFDRTVRLWSTRTAELLRVIHGPVGAVQFTRDGRELLTAGPRGYLVVWDVTLDARSPEEIARVVEHGSPWRLEGGRLVEVAP
ncbi:MAG: protein kinase [Polyangiaceae bacterium]